MTNPGTKIRSRNGDSAVEIRLGQIAAFQPVIAAYEKTLGSKNERQSRVLQRAPDEKPSTSSTPFTPMFSQPGMAGSLDRAIYRVRQFGTPACFRGGFRRDGSYPIDYRRRQPPDRTASSRSQAVCSLTRWLRAVDRRSGPMRDARRSMISCS